jgi:hypothetical protein
MPTHFSESRAEHLVFECGRDKGGVVAAETK